jgi:hypothetical protein
MLRRPLLAVALLCTSAAACNAITGVNDLGIASGPGGTGASGTGAGTAAGPGGGGGSAPMGLSFGAQGVTISEVAIYQGVKRSLMGGTPPTSGITVPIVAGRDALIRVFVTTDAKYDGSPVTGHLYLDPDPTPIEVVGAVSASKDSSLASTVNFEVPGAAIVAGLNYRIELTQPFPHAVMPNPAASFSAKLDVTTDGKQFKLALVPVRYGADGSNRMPDTSAGQVQGYKDKFMGTYPIDKIDLQMHAPFAWNQPIYADGTGWGELLDALANLRQQEGASPDLYYFGIFNPDTSFDQYCAGGCVAGLGLIGSAQDDYSRAAIGLGYSGADAFVTAIHEVGHTQGRNHAPCGGAQGVDPGFPYKNGSIGVWGYDLIAKQLIDPASARDMMGYCDNNWISDYTFKAIFDRMKTVNGAAYVVPPGLRNQAWERARFDGQGHLTWLTPVTLARPPIGELTDVTVQSAAGAEVVGGHVFPYDHLPGGVLMWQKAPDGAARAQVSSIQVTLDGKVSSLSR